ncbi:MAG: hypothetical protein QF886_23765, partial [Planctomycetota bacterium]|nr:hypothetical protein [Planctomycetota bacterium]
MRKHSDDQILKSLRSILLRIRTVSVFERSFPWLMGALLIAILAKLILAPGFTGPVIALAGIEAAYCLYFEIVRAFEIRLQHAAARTDFSLNLPDDLSAYVQYESKPSRTSLEQAHLNRVRNEFAQGIAWRPGGFGALKSVVLILWVALLIFVKPTTTAPPTIDETRRLQNPLSPGQRLLQAAIEALRNSGNEPLATSLEQMAKTPSPTLDAERKRYLDQLREVKHEVTSAEGRLAGKFLADLIAKSTKGQSP